MPLMGLLFWKKNAGSMHLSTSSVPTQQKLASIVMCMFCKENQQGKQAHHYQRHWNKRLWHHKAQIMFENGAVHEW